MWTQLRLDPASGVPLYRQLYESVRTSIETGRLAMGDRLPPTRELAGLLGLNRTTVSAAYELLEKEGYIRGHVGRGSFVDRGAAQPSSPESADKRSQSAASANGIISFATSRPSSDMFPLDEFRMIAAEVAGGPDLSALLQLGSPLGLASLRQFLRDRLAAEGPARPTDDVLITNGCQQAIDLLVRTLVQPGDLVVVEDPVYPGLREVLLRAGARLAGIPMTDSGVAVDELDRALRRERARLVVVTPTFQNPTGTSLPLSSRVELLRVTAGRGVTVVENDIYSGLRYEGVPVPSLKQLDGGSDVVQLGSFSKISFPGLRVGWMLAPKGVIESCAAVRQWMDLHTDQFSQAVLLRFAETGLLERHRQRVVAAGAVKLAATLDACQTCLPEGARFTRPEGGMNLWVRLPEPIDSAELLARTQARGVSFLPGQFFAVSRPEPSSLRLSFAGLSVEEIRRGLAILGEEAAAELRRARPELAPRLATAMV